METVKDFKVVNHSVGKIDSLSLAMGKPSYVADLKPANALIVKMLWSPHAHAVIKSIDISGAEKMEGVHAVLYYGNTPQIRHCTAGQGYPEPSPWDTVSFDRKVRCVGDRVAAVAAETLEIAEAAVKKIKVEYDLLEPVFGFEAPLAEGAPIIHDEPDATVPIPIPYEPKKNIVATVGMEEGDIAKDLKEADVSLEYTWETPYAQHVPIETHVGLAQIDARGRIQIHASTQVPFHSRRLCAQAIGVPVQQIRVIKPRIGGGFGSKQEMLMEDVVALFTQRTRRPCFWELTREENFRTGRTRHPIKFQLKTAMTKDGTLTGISMDAICNTGAYGGHGLPVVGCCGSKVLPLYHWKHIHFHGTVVYTNMPVGGAYRGFGATQAYFATECQIDEMAHIIGMDPVELRLKNHLSEGDGSPVFAALGEGKAGVEQTIGSCGLADCITLGAKEIGWLEKRSLPETKSGRYRRGLGMCALMQGSSIPEIDMGAASIKLNEDGSFNLLVGAADLGTGSDTVLGQIAAEELGTTIDKMIVYSSDTDMTPFDVGAYASSTTYLSGEAARKAAAKVKAQMVGVAAEMMDKPVNELTVSDAKVSAKDGTSVTFSEISLYSLYEKNQFQIMDSASHITHKSPPPYSAHFVEIEVDTWTGNIDVIHYVAGIDCGTAINPRLCEGQTEGGIMNGISYALCEEYLFDPNGEDDECQPAGLPHLFAAG